MKRIVVLSFLMSCFFTDMRGQVTDSYRIPDSILMRMDEMGIDEADTLTELECLYFMFRFPNPDSNFNYAGKKIHFKHTYGGGKRYFFSEERRLLRIQGQNMGMGAVIYWFDESEKKLYDIPYDVVVHCWTKFILPKKKIANMIKPRQ